MWIRLRKIIAINRAIRKHRILVSYNPFGEYFNCTIWEYGITEHLTVFKRHDKRLYNKLKRKFPMRFLNE